MKDFQSFDKQYAVACNLHQLEKRLQLLIVILLLLNWKTHLILNEQIFIYTILIWNLKTGFLLIAGKIFETK